MTVTQKRLHPRDSKNVRRWAGLTVLIVGLGGCATPGHAPLGTMARVRVGGLPVDVPAPGLGREIEPGVLFSEVSLPRPGGPSKVWIYLPARPTQSKLPCILVAPAGSPLFSGMDLGAGDRREHLPYVRAGYAVVAYEIDGNLGDEPRGPELLKALNAFKESGAGVGNAQLALDYALAKVPQIDSNRIYTAGHSSAATLSLLVAEHEPRIKACIAYAPACNIPQRLGSKLVSHFSGIIPGYQDFVQWSSPDTNAAELRCPLFLFHADDDSNVPLNDVTSFVEKVKLTNPRVTFVRVPAGGHYESMIQQGIPQAIQWLNGLQGGATPR